jgi:hypothetical protein
MLRMESAQSKVSCTRFSRCPILACMGGFTHHVPDSWGPEITPCTLYLTLGIESPYWLQTRGNFWSKYGTQRVPCITISEPDELGSKMMLKYSYPVAKITASVSSVLPSVNSRKACVKRASWLSFLSLILPSIISWLAPTSVPRNYGSVRKEKAVRDSRTEVVPAGLGPHQ